MLLCGIGLPLPEELILVAAGYVAYRGELAGDGHHPAGLALTASVAILVGDSIPYVLGRKFGPKLLRLRLVRTWITQEGLARFDRWFQRHGRLTIFVARFLPGIRVPAFFTAGSMNTSVARFLMMDGLGVLISAPLFVWLGYYFGEDITTLVEWVRRAEHTVLWAIGIGVVLAVAIYFFWYRRRRTQRLLGAPVTEATVGATVRARADREDASHVLVDVGEKPDAQDPDAQDKGASERDIAPHPATEPETPARERGGGEPDPSAQAEDSAAAGPTTGDDPRASDSD